MTAATPTPDREAAIRARCEAATPGPWEADRDIEQWQAGQFPGCRVGYWRERYSSGAGIVGALAIVGSRHGAGNPINDAAFIAAARTDLPWALEEIKRLREALEWIAEGKWTESGDLQGAAWSELRAVNRASQALAAPPTTEGNNG